MHTEGFVPLFKLGEDTDVFLEVKGLVERLDSDPTLCGGLGFYFTEIYLTGSGLGHRQIIVKKERNLNFAADGQFIMDSDGNQTRFNDQQSDDDIIVEEYGPNPLAISICPSINEVTLQNTSSVKIKMKENIIFRIEAQTRGLTQKETSGFLNLYMYGIKKYAKTARGILGNDDASQWINVQANDECLGKKQKCYVSKKANQTRSQKSCKEIVGFHCERFGMIQT